MSPPQNPLLASQVTEITKVVSNISKGRQAQYKPGIPGGAAQQRIKGTKAKLRQERRDARAKGGTI